MGNFIKYSIEFPLFDSNKVCESNFSARQLRNVKINWLFVEIHLGLVVYDDSDASKSDDETDSDGERANVQHLSDNDSDSELMVGYALKPKTP